MRGSFFCLVKREFYTSKKGFITGSIGLAAAMVLFILILLSAYHGNIKQMFDYIVEPAQAASEMTEYLDEQIALTTETISIYYKVIALAVKYVPLLYAGFLASTVANTAIYDDKKLWVYFRRSTPVPPWKFSLANAVMYAIAAVFEIAVGVVYLAIISAVTGTEFLAQDIAVLLTFIAVGLLFAFIFQTLIKLLHSVDRAGIALVIAVFGTVVPYNIIHTIVDPEGAKQAADNGFDIQGTLDFLTNNLLPFLPLIIVAILSLIFISNYILLERREK